MRRPIQLLVIMLAFFIPLPLIAQDNPAPTPTPPSRSDQIDEQKKLIEKETELLEARRKYLEEFSKASGTHTVTRDTSGGKTEFDTDAVPILETVKLSYEAIAELSAKVDQRLKPMIHDYDRLVIYNDPDFLALSRYRLYREQARQALESYDALKKKIDETPNLAGGDKIFTMDSADNPRSGAGSALVTGLAIPGIATSAINSVAELLSLFRTDIKITQSVNVVTEQSLKAVLAGALLNANTGLSIYNPEQFVPEYNIGIGEDGSFYQELVRLDAAEVYLDLFLDETSKLPASQQNAVPLSRLIFAAKNIKKQISKITFTIATDTNSPFQSGQAEIAWFQQMVRAEKLDRFLRRATPSGVSPRPGILKVRMLSSGGSRRESKNLLLGTKTDYSGSAVIEVALYDLDGTLRISEVFAYHTGFRKFKTDEKPKP